MAGRLSVAVGMIVLGTSSSAAELAQSTSKQMIRSAQQLSDTAYLAVKQGQGLVEVKQSGIPFGSVRGYDTAHVNSNIQKIRGELIGGLKRDDLGGLHAYVEEFFPSVQLRTFEVPASFDTTCSVTPCPLQLAEPESVEEMYGYVRQFVDKVATATAYKISFQVRSTPTGARFSMQPLGGGFMTEIATDGTVGNVFRGLYRYSVQREGFKKIEATLNLVDNSPDELHCELIDLKKNSDALPCLFGLIE